MGAKFWNIASVHKFSALGSSGCVLNPSTYNKEAAEGFPAVYLGYDFGKPNNDHPTN